MPQYKRLKNAPLFRLQPLSLTTRIIDVIDESGTPVLEVVLEETCVDYRPHVVEAYVLKQIDANRKTIGIPQCIHVRLMYGREDIQGTITFQMSVTMILVVPSELYDDAWDNACCNCGDECECVDDHRIREKHCQRCAPDLLCEECRLLLPDGSSTCIQCVEKGDIIEMSTKQTRRYDAVMAIYSSESSWIERPSGFCLAV